MKEIEEIIELEDRTTKVMQSEKQTEKINRVSMNYGTITKDLTFVP